MNPKPIKFPSLVPNGGDSPLHLPSAMRAQKLQQMGLARGWKLVTDGEIGMIIRDVQDSKNALAAAQQLLAAAAPDKEALDFLEKTTPLLTRSTENVGTDQEWCCSVATVDKIAFGRTARAAIKAAMALAAAAGETENKTEAK